MRLCACVHGLQSAHGNDCAVTIAQMLRQNVRGHGADCGSDCAVAVGDLVRVARVWSWCAVVVAVRIADMVAILIADAV